MVIPITIYMLCCVAAQTDGLFACLRLYSFISDGCVPVRILKCFLSMCLGADMLVRLCDCVSVLVRPCDCVNKLVCSQICLSVLLSSYPRVRLYVVTPVVWCACSLLCLWH